MLRVVISAVNYVRTGYHQYTLKYDLRVPAEEFDCAVVYALQQLRCPSMQLKTEQKAAIKTIYDRKDVFVWLPTSFWKSICYTTLPFVFDYKLGRVDSSSHSVVLVISPLTSLMVDQVVSLRAVHVEINYPAN